MGGAWFKRNEQRGALRAVPSHLQGHNFGMALAGRQGKALTNHSTVLDQHRANGWIGACAKNKPDRIRTSLTTIASTGLLLPATLARHLGLRELVDHHLDLGGAPGRANTGDKMLTLVASALAVPITCLASDRARFM